MQIGLYTFADTTRIRLTSAVSVLSSDDPVRVFQEFATLDLVSGGRAEIMAGRGSFIESFPLFGWVAVGGTPQSVARAGALGLPMALAIIGGSPKRFAPLVAHYRESARRAGQDAGTLAVGINSHGYIADTARRAVDGYYPSYAAMMSRIGLERGWPPMTREQYDALCGPDGALFVGAPDDVAEKIVQQHALFAHQRFLLSVGSGTLPHDQVLRSIELLGTRVAPTVRRALAGAGALVAAEGRVP